jgi:uncharacterized protein YndB with AHSA1/START domain
MKRYSMTYHVDASPERVFAYLMDPKGGLASTQDMRMELVAETPDGVGTTYRWESQMLGLRASGICVFTEYVPDERVKMEFTYGPEMLLFGGPLSSTWSCKPADGGTDLTIEAMFRTFIPVVNQVGRWLMMRSWVPQMKADIAKIEKLEKKVPAAAGRRRKA